MKLLNLELKAVGPFTDVSLNFGPGDHGLHLIHGPNEAGKSSTLRAITYLLFGFPHQVSDDFVHANAQLRVGGTLRHSDTTELTILRRKGRVNTLRASDDTTVIPEDRLAPFLGGMNPEMFAGLFGINHERLTQAGEEIRTGKGQLGEMLFAAGAGLAGLRKAQETLQNRLDDLFKPQGKNPSINKAISEYRAAQEKLKQLNLPSEDWQRHDMALRDAIKQAERLRGTIQARRSEEGRLKRVKSAVPLVARRRRLLRERDELGHAIRLRDQFGDEARQAQDQARLSEQTITSTRAALDEIHQQREALNPPDHLLDAGAQVESLQEKLGAVTKAHEDLTRNLEPSLTGHENQARKLLRELGRPVDFDQAESLRLRADEPTIIRELAQRLALLRGQADDARRQMARHEDVITRRERERADLEPPLDVEPLRAAVRQIRRAGDLEPRLLEARARLQKAEKAAERAVARLPAWDRSADELRTLAPPLTATIDQLESRLQEANQKRIAIDGRLAAEDDEIARLQSALQTLDAHQDLPSEQSLALTRSSRDANWHQVKQAWLSGGDARIQPDQIPPRSALSTRQELALANEYEKSVFQADTVADRLRQEADRVARKAESLAQLDQHTLSRDALACELQKMAEQVAAIDRDWLALVAPRGLGAEARTPAQLREWLRRRDEVLQLLEKVDEAAQAVEPVEREIETHRATLKRLWQPAWGTCPFTDANLTEALEHADALIQRQDATAKKLATLETKLGEARQELARTALALDTAQSELENARAGWAVKMTRLGLEPDADPKQAEVVLSHLAELFDVLEKRREAATRIAGIHRDAELFATDVESLAARVAPDVTGRPPADAARELASRLKQARSDAQRAVDLEQQRDRAEAALQAATEERDQSRIRLERLCHEAGCQSIDQLSEAERRSQAVARLQAELATCEEQLSVHAANASLDSFVAEVDATSPELLDSELARLEAEIESLETELRALDQTIGAERAELERMDGSDHAAVAAETMQNLLARLQGDVTRYATLRLAASVLGNGIERYRDKNQGPIIHRASALFASLTVGSFAKLQIDDDGDGRSVLKGVRPDGKPVGIEGMSDGSHDQLYLALRLASLESWLLSHEPIPFIVDDILLNFDDRRSTAALLALAELATRTQVLFFTHHRHVIELARASLPANRFSVHELPAR
jgi:uncharacterized protein YhaN